MAITLTAPKSETASRRGDALGRVLAVVLLSVYGGWFSTIALMVIAYRLTGSVAAPAALVVVRILARLIGAVPGGVLADRHGAGRAVAMCAAAQAAVCVAVASLLDHGTGGLWLVYAATAVAQTAAGMAQSATGGLVVQSVAPERRGHANGLVGTVVSSSVLVGPGAAALGVAVLPPTSLLVVNAVFAMATIAVAAYLPRPRPTPREERTRSWLAGPSAVLGDGFLRSFALAWGIETVAVGAAQAAFAAAAVERFGGDAAVGLLYAVVGVGAISGSAVATRWRPAAVGPGAVLIPSIGAVATIALFAAVPSRGLAAAGLLVAGFLAGLYQPWGMTELQRRVPPAVAGRVTGAIVSVQFGGTLIGSTMGLLILAFAGWETAVVGPCVAALVIAAVGLPLCRQRAHGDPVARPDRDPRLTPRTDSL